ncbi:transcription factor WhiB [Mumia flava]|uniref:Transcription factor WhiB n=1 Tax=Mumia flava TaxID=1348852 RepID=A0A2M9BHT1_9ACTN|nr:WhiB family transcriptional regulator [Mumia flava]PJJ57508.1 transcription factor WhiB [Mumia flava]
MSTSRLAGRRIALSEDVVPACALLPEVYGLLAEPADEASDTPDSWLARHNALAAARQACAACPLLTACLYRAVVEADVAGYAACTTEADRTLLRERLGVAVASVDLDAIAGVRAGGRGIDHDAIVAVRRAYPKETFAQLAERLGCSLSTVKRHLRGYRGELPEPRPAEKDDARPSLEAVLDAFDEVVGDARARALTA